MPFLRKISLAASILLSGAWATPQATPTVIAPPPGETFAIGYPICNVSGYTYLTNTYTEYIYEEANSTLSACIQGCRTNSTCNSIAWVPEYTECIFYDECVEKTYLILDADSFFFHYDNICDIV